MAASTVVSEVMGKVAFVHKLPMVLKATADNDTPTAGYLYQEISDLTFVSSSYCKSLLDVLVDRLDKSSHHIKYKVLRVMKYVVENGSEQFRIDLLRRSTGIQLATKFSGPPDQLHGNAPYIAVRTAAKELSEVLFDTEQSEPKEAGHKRTAAVGGLGASRSGVSMEGFGSTDRQPTRQKSLGETIKEGFWQLTDSFQKSPTVPDQSGYQGEYRPLRGAEVDERSSSSSSFSSSSSSFLFSSGKAKPLVGVGSLGGRGEYRPVRMDEAEPPTRSARNGQPSNLDVKRVTSAHRRGKPAGGWEDGSNTSNSDGQHSGDSTELSERLESVAVEDVSLETKLVEEFVAAVDGKPTPSRDAVSQFVKRCFTLNCEKVTELLASELKSGPTLIRMRCLCALEALMREDTASADHLLGFLPDTLRELQSSTADRLLQAKASKILWQLERVKEEAEATKSPKRRDMRQSSTLIDPIIPGSQPADDPMVRDVREPGTTAVTVPRPAVESSVSVGPSTSLFSGMALGLGSAPAQRGQGVPQRAIAQAAEEPVHEVLGCGQDGSAGSAQLLDDLLDLSWTGRPTLVPAAETHAVGETWPDQPLSSGGGTHQSSLLQFPAQDTHKRAKELDRDFIEGMAEQGTSLPSGETPHAETPSSVRQPQQPDSIMSRKADLSDLLAATGIALPTAQTEAAQAGNLARDPAPALATAPAPSRPVQPGAPLALSTDQISTMYPQLAGVRLSGSTAMPLDLSKRPADGNFAFAARNGSKENSQRAGRFDFVREAMAASKK